MIQPEPFQPITKGVAMNLRKLTIALGLAGLVSACDQVSQSPQDRAATKPGAAVSASISRVQDDTPVVVTVNGTDITEAMVTVYEQQRARRAGMQGQQDRGAIMEELISLELARQDALDNALNNKPDVAIQIDQQARTVLAAAAIQGYLEKNPITDEELQQVYDEKVGSPGSEYKARHILVEDKEAAEKLIAELDKGADFAELAKEHSTGPSGKNGGDLGWFSADQMVAPFSEATAKLKKGEYTKTPVQTQFGWHVIMLEDSRESTPPSFEQVKPQLRAFVQNQRVQAYVDGLKREATIVVAETPASEPAMEESDMSAGGSDDAGDAGSGDSGAESSGSAGDTGTSDATGDASAAESTTAE
jgi:peptidyl-prolyl cis-trans isomerase C